jgi:thioredoxin 1
MFSSSLSHRILLLVAAAIALVSNSHQTEAFAPRLVVLSQRVGSSTPSSASQRPAVLNVDNEGTFDQTVQSNPIVIIDYSTTWCGPCKVIAPKFEELSEKYPQVTFVKVIGDASLEASKLMKREGVRSVPSFHYFVSGEKVDVVNGANAEAIEAAITKHVMA